METDSLDVQNDKDKESSVKNFSEDSAFTEISESSLSSSDIPGDNIITKEMVKEEEEIRDQLSAEENNFKKKMTDKDKEQSFQHLLNLLSRSQLYAKYLKDKMEEQKEQTARKQQQQVEQSRKRLEKQQKENVVQINGRTTRGSLKNNNLKNEPEPQKKKRGRPKSSNNSLQIQNEKRKKLENNRTTVDKKEMNDGDSLEQENFKVDERLAEQISPRQPSLLVGGVMRDYQLEGFEWMKVLYENGINGILADEMGLGKTIQCIALVAHLIGKAMAGPYLIVAPLSTLPNWLAEFQRFTPQLPVILYHGKKEEREYLRRKISKERSVGNLWTKPVVLTSYDIAIKDAPFLRNHHWRYLIVDEGHRLKNFNSRLFIELKRYPAANRLLLTGTPLQNNMSELWSLLNFLLPEIFDNLTVFESWFDVETMSSDQSDETIIAQEQEKRIISTLHEILNPFLLRRTKADVDLNLPPKKEIMVYAPLTPTQELFYKAVLDKSISNLLKERSGQNSYFEPTVLESKRRSSVKITDYSVFERDLTEKELKILDKAPPDDFTDSVKTVHEYTKTAQKVVQLSTEVKLNTRNMLMPLRKICNHPYLLEYPLDLETGSYKVDEELVKACGKLQILDCMLPALKKEGHKVLLFSQMTSLLNIIEDYCSLRNFAYVRLDGTVKLEDRQNDILAFNQDPSIFLFLLSTRAGGLGINLTSADTVIIYDSDWNPQCDLQAQDRCHRFGQTKPVVVYRLVTANTIDEKIVTRAAAKRKLEKMIIKKGRFSKSLGDGTANNLSAFSPEELTELLKSTDHSGVVRTDGEQLLTPEQLDLLLDRSDLLSPPHGVEPSTVPQQDNGFFRLLSSDVNNSNVEPFDETTAKNDTD